ncbi:YebC-like protein [Artomyces pyxidatus]|uniref:YebC-like protein n=1 Tax=Artomyces pyxidatus TaxID=48021 RepID=A0ACB8T260_9AGAM|nr:YebC-like protein [Artomyces pyxidatus]
MLARVLRSPCQRPFSTSSPLFSGHNKWSKIKQKKGVMDAQKSQIYGRANREILLAVRNGGSADPEKNIALFNTLKKARADGVPKANIESALQKAIGGKDKGDQLATYEAMAHGSVGVVIECLTDNGNRTVHKLREILKRHNANFATVGFMFQRKGCVRLALQSEKNQDALIEVALEAGAEDFDSDVADGGGYEIEFVCPPPELARLTAAVTAPELGAELLTSELIYAPSEAGAVEDDALENMIGELVGELEENEDTLHVWTTLDT